MYFVDRNQIEETLDEMSRLLDIFNEKNEWNTALEKLALERLVQVLIEALIDVGNQMIDGFIMRDPGSYEDIVDILIDEAVVPKSSEVGLKAVIRERKTLVQNYRHINHNRLIDVLQQYHTVWEAFPNAVRSFLEKELGPVSAFKPLQGEDRR